MDIPRPRAPFSDMSCALSPTEHLRAGLGNLNVNTQPEEPGTSPILLKSARRRLQQSFDSPPTMIPSVQPSLSASVISQSPSQVETTQIFRSASSDLLRRKEKGRARAGSCIQAPVYPYQSPSVPQKQMSRSFTSLPAFKPGKTDSNTSNKENIPESPASARRRSWRTKSTYLAVSTSSPSVPTVVKPLDLSRVLGSEDANHEFPSTESAEDMSSEGSPILAASCSALPFIFNHHGASSTPITAHPSPSLPVPSGEWPPLKHMLPLVVNHEHPDLPTISPQTMSELLQGRYRTDYQECFVIDCRFGYEFSGGHIKGALNMSKCELLEEFFFKRSTRGRNVLIIFYCEFSSKRGPTGFKHLREIDRKENYHNYPNLSYPNVYLLEGGYSNFFKSFKEYCDPVGYVQMFDKNFQEELKSEMRATQLSLTRSRGRSQSFSTLHF